MTTLTASTLQRRLLQTVGEAVAIEQEANGSLGETIRLGVGIVRELRESVARTRRELEEELAGGVEGRSFARSYHPLLPATDEYQVQLRRLLEEISGAEGTAAGSFVAELRLLEEEAQAFRDLLAEAVSRASEAPRPLDLERVKAAEAAYARGAYNRISPR